MTPSVSVVMSVYNGGDRLAATLDSILGQQGCDLELIVIDDGSSDGSGDVLEQRARADARVRVLRQQNMGLTRSLIRGCDAARGEYIARHDAGDVSLPGRLHRQREYLEREAGAVMVACGTGFIGPAGESLYEITQRGDELERGLANLHVGSIRGPSHHGATMFRKDAYVAAGGYRPAFTVAQDLDLWLRLAERGPCTALDACLYRAQIAPGSISARARPQQLRMAGIAIECAKRRRAGLDDADLLVTAQRLPANAPAMGQERRDKARLYFFVGSCLREKDPEASRRYFRMAWRENPLFVRAMIRAAFG